jgi:hypothetical protein
MSDDTGVELDYNCSDITYMYIFLQFIPGKIIIIKH